LEYCHEIAEVIHRDLKPENILLDENDRVKLADFGVSAMMDNGCDEITTTAGSNFYFSPEACNGSKFKGKGNDIWASGVVLYYLCMNRLPFEAGNFPDLFYMIKNDEPDYTIRELDP
jgi:serine/threonine protein kinase